MALGQHMTLWTGVLCDQWQGDSRDNSPEFEMQVHDPQSLTTYAHLSQKRSKH